MTPDKSVSPMTVQQLLDREQIRDVAMRYCRGVDRLDADCMKSAYWPEAIDEHGSFIGNAHDFSDYCMTAHLRWKWTMHSIYNHQIDFDDDGVHARGELYNITNLGRADSGDIDTWYGRYLDRYEKRGNEWRIMHRVCPQRNTNRYGYADGDGRFKVPRRLLRSTRRRTPTRPLSRVSTCGGADPL